MSDKSDTSDASYYMPPPETNTLPAKRAYTQVLRVFDLQF